MRIIHGLALSALTLGTAAWHTPASAEKVTVAIAVGGKSYKASGEGKCQYAATASYYDMRAKMWSVEYSVEGKSGLTNLHLTAWRPLAGGADQMSLSLQIGSADHRIDTVSKSENVGSGTLTVKTKGEGGTFQIDGKDKKGRTIKGTVECTSFSAPHEVAG
jgi:hypothetical protein